MQPLDLATLGQRQRGEAAEQGLQLGPRQRVALDVRAIAEVTFLTPVQAERHLATARGKLGAAEDAELGRALAEQAA
jgi:hypothetical protein